MRTTKLAMLAIMAIVATALSGSTAAATNSVEFSEIADGTSVETHCPTLATGGCQVHLVGVQALRIDLGVFGEAAEATCTLEVDMKLNESGDISIHDVNQSRPGDANCTDESSAFVIECKLPWSGKGESTGKGVVLMSATMCLNTAESGSDCEGALKFNLVEDASGHIDTVINNAAVGLCELDISLEVEHAEATNDKISITP